MSHSYLLAEFVTNNRTIALIGNDCGGSVIVKIYYDNVLRGSFELNKDNVQCMHDVLGKYLSGEFNKREDR